MGGLWNIRNVQFAQGPGHTAERDGNQKQRNPENNKQTKAHFTIVRWVQTRGRLYPALCSSITEQAASGLNQSKLTESHLESAFRTNRLNCVGGSELHCIKLNDCLVSSVITYRCGWIFVVFPIYSFKLMAGHSPLANILMWKYVLENNLSSRLCTCPWRTRLCVLTLWLSLTTPHSQTQKCFSCLSVALRGTKQGTS